MRPVVRIPIHYLRSEGAARRPTDPFDPFAKNASWAPAALRGTFALGGTFARVVRAFFPRSAQFPSYLPNQLGRWGPRGSARLSAALGRAGRTSRAGWGGAGSPLTAGAPVYLADGSSSRCLPKANGTGGILPLAVAILRSATSLETAVRAVPRRARARRAQARVRRPGDKKCMSAGTGTPRKPSLAGKAANLWGTLP